MIQRSTFFLSILLICFTAKAQWTTYTTGNTTALSASCVNDMLQTPDHKIWFATNQGLWTHSPSSSLWEKVTLPTQMNNCFIYDIFRDNLGRIWIGTDSYGAACYNNGSWQVYTSSSGLAGNMVRSITQDAVGYLWFATYDGGLSRFSGSVWTTYNTDDGLPTNSFLSAFYDSYGRLWFGTAQHGVVMKNYAGWNYFTTSDGMTGNTVFSIMEDSDHKVYLSGSNGISTYFGGFWDGIGTGDGLPDDFVYRVMQVADSTYWIATDSGIAVYNYDSIYVINSDSGLSENAVFSLLKDNLGNYWTGHRSLGVSEYKNHHWYNYNNNSGILSNYFYDAAQDSNGVVWFATNAGLSKFDPDLGWSTLTYNDGLPGNSFMNVKITQDGNIWVLFYYNGYYRVSRFNGSSWFEYDYTNGLVAATPYCMAQDLNDHIWIGYYGSPYVSEYNGTSWISHNVGATMYTEDILATSSGDIFLATDDGVYRYHSGAWQHYTVGSGLPVTSTRALTQDSDGNVYVGLYDYYDGGIARFTGTSWVPVYSAESPHYVLGLYTDSYDHVWVGGYQSMYPWLFSYYDGTNWRHFQEPEGLEGYTYNDFFEDASHNIWALSYNGVSVTSLLTLGTQETETPEMLSRVYPNPADDEFLIELESGNSGDIIFHLYDMTGKLQFQADRDAMAISNNTFRIDCSTLPSGIYFYTLSGKDLQEHGKISITH